MTLKDKPLGIKLICCALCIPIVLFWIVTALNYFNYKEMFNSSDEQKMEIIRGGHMTDPNVKTVDDFNRYLGTIEEKQKKGSGYPGMVWSIVPFVLSFGLLKFAKWARVGMFIYVGYLVLGSFSWFGLSSKANSMQQLGKIVSLPVLVTIVWYLTRPRIKELFK
ncbi:MAG: hypothetical protein HQL20_08435 [Candidatus Omnitrophica bacterium]|nr:hypothetical protein [Candidatus Omnitrophota bacterium]